MMSANVSHSGKNEGPSHPARSPVSSSPSLCVYSSTCTEETKLREEKHRGDTRIISAVLCVSPEVRHRRAGRGDAGMVA